MSKNNELYDRMCKKISQLTRVIFILNTKNDENDSLIESIVDSYEKEIENIISESNLFLNNLKQNIDKVKENDGQDEKIIQMKKKIEDVLQKNNNENEKFKKETTSKLNKSIVEYNDKVEKMKIEVNELKKVFDSRIIEVQKRGNDDKTVLKLEIDKLKKVNSSLEDRIKEGNDQHKIQLERMRTDLKGENKLEKEKIIGDYERRINDLKIMNDKENSTANKAFLEIKEIKKEFEDKINGLNKEIILLKEKNEALIKEKDQLNEKIKSYENGISIVKNENNDLKLKLKEMKLSEDKSNESNTSKISNLKEEIEKERSIVKEKQNEIYNLKEEVNRLQKESKSNISSCQGQLNQLNIEKDSLKKRIFELESIENYNKSYINEILLEKKKLEEEASILKSELFQLKNKNLNDKTEMEKERTKIEEEMKSYINSLNKEILELKIKYDNMILQKDDDKKNIIMKYEQDITYNNKSNLEYIDNLKSEYEKEISHIKSRLTTISEEEIQKLILKVNELNGDLYNKQGEIRGNNEEIFKLKSEVNELLIINNEYKEKINSLNEKHNKTIMDINNNASIKEKDISNKINSIKEEFSLLEKELNEKHKKEISLLKEGFFHEKDSIISKNNNKIHQINKENDRKVNDLYANINELTSKIKLLQKSFEDGINNNSLNFERERQQLKEENEKQMKIYSNELYLKDKRLDETIEKYNKDINELRTYMNNQRIEEINSIISTKQKEMDDIKRQLTLENETLKLRHNEEVESLKVQFVKEKHDINEINKSNISSKDHIILEKDKEINENNRKINEINERITEKDKEIYENNTIIKDYIIRLEKNKNELQSEKEKFTSYSLKLNNEHEEKLKNMENVFFEKTDKFKKDNLEDISKLKEEFKNIIHMLENKTKIITDKYNELKEVFDRRPSREEDLERISNLMIELKKSQKLIQNYEGKAEFYKNELDIREENYNNKFNYKPNVGYYDPLKANLPIDNPQKRNSEKQISLKALKIVKALSGPSGTK